MRIVVKVGTSTLAHPTGRLNIQRMERLCKVLSDLKNAGHEIILVSSGAIGMGVGKLSLPSKPSDMPTKQAAAAVGQCELMYKNPSARLIDTVEQLDERIYALAGGEGSSLGTGGMVTKLRAAKIATDAGCEMVIANGSRPENLYDILDGAHVGTRFLTQEEGK